MFCLSLLALVGCGPGPADVAGTWELDLRFDGIQRDVTLELTTDDGGELAGTWTGMRGSWELLEPRLSLGKLWFEIEPETIGGPLRMRFAGMFQGDRLVGTLQAGQGELMLVEAVRSGS
ncbi:MAG: hypothetical protein SX243_18470 [Acidobacteriota bacterium]|nr:hypothetical protein [Acidobacteriota bacterium]